MLKTVKDNYRPTGWTKQITTQSYTITELVTLMLRVATKQKVDTGKSARKLTNLANLTI